MLYWPESPKIWLTWHFKNKIKYSQTCIKRPPLVHRRQVNSNKYGKRFPGRFLTDSKIEHGHSLYKLSLQPWASPCVRDLSLKSFQIKSFYLPVKKSYRLFSLSEKRLAKPHTKVTDYKGELSTKQSSQVAIAEQTWNVSIINWKLWQANTKRKRPAERKDGLSVKS